MLSTMGTVIRRELLIAFRRQADIFNPLWFFIIVITLFPLSIGPETRAVIAHCAGDCLGSGAAFRAALTRASVS
ncbi:heme exporter protein CcmB [Vibrio sp. CDRSL-10 TSBA]